MVMKRYSAVVLGLLMSIGSLKAADRCRQCAPTVASAKVVLVNFAAIASSIISIAASEDPYNPELLAKEGSVMVQSLARIIADALKSLPAERRLTMTEEELQSYLCEEMKAQGLPEKLARVLLTTLEQYAQEMEAEEEAQ